MNEFRRNTAEEKEIVRARFKVPIFLKVILGILIVQCIIFTFNFEMFIVVFGFSIIPILALIIVIIGIKKSSCIVTDKRIKGVTNFFIAKKKYSYRLDEIDNVETISTMGIHGLALNFTQGHGPQGRVIYNRGIATVNGAGTFRITNIKNIDEVYEKLSDLITSVKNDKDLMVDIEMSKIEAENRKANAFESMAKGFGGAQNGTEQSSNFIKELKDLKELLDAGVLTPQEFEQKKKEMLNK